VAQSPPELGPNPRILVIRLSALGDTLLTLPAVALLRDRFPGAHIGFLTDARHAELLDGVETIDQVLILDRLALKRARRAAIAGLWRDLLRPLVGGKWDAVIDFQSYTETAALGAMTRAGVRVGRRYKTTASWLYSPWIDAPHPETYMPFAHADTLVEAGLIADPPSTLDLYFTPSVQARTAWATTLAGLRLSPAAPRIALFVGAAREDRRWPAERFAELAMALDRQAATPPNFLVLAGPSESAVAEAVIAAGAPISDRLVRAPTASLHELAAAFSDCSMAICNDTGPLHLSIAVGTPTCGIYRRPLAHFLAPPPHRSVVAPELRVDQIPLEDVLSSVAELT
jgi:ADP-heptose:LPS heptosyltransferase